MQSLPKNLLSYARKIRYNDKSLFRWALIIWLHDVYPEDFREYMRKCKGVKK